METLGRPGNTRHITTYIVIPTALTKVKKKSGFKFI